MPFTSPRLPDEIAGTMLFPEAGDRVMPMRAERRTKRKATGIVTMARTRAAGRTVLRETIRDVQARNAQADLDELQSLIDEEMANARGSFWTQPRQ
jgi:hypothetical protein